MNNPCKIVLTGAESTGKSTLSEKLAAHFQTIWIPEFSREYIEKLNRKYTYEDIEAIARHQLASESNLPECSIVIYDTWLIITKVWFDFVYGKHPTWLHEAILSNKIDLFLLCDIDMPWEDDPVRENGGENRQKLHEIYLRELKDYNFNVEIISGYGEERFQNAVKAVNKYLQQH